MTGIVIIGSGPSITKADVLIASSFPTISFNRSYLIFKEWGFSPTYYAAFDPVVIKEIASNVENDILPYIGDSLFFNRKLLEILPKHEKIKFINIRQDKTPNFSTEDISDCGTVGASSLQLAGALGYKKIVLLGMDANYSLQNLSSNHFIPEYSKGIAPPPISSLDFMFKGWEEVAQLCKNSNIEVVNSSKITELTCFNKSPLSESLLWLKE